MDKIVEKIFKLVKEKFPQQKDFAKSINTTPSIVSEWKRGKSSSYKYKMDEIAKALGVTVAELYGESAPAALTDPMAGFDKDKDYLMVLKDKNGISDTVLMSQGLRLPVEAVEVAEAYLALDTAGRNMVRRMLGLADVQSPKSQIG